jgi:hypothetical protein
MTTIRYRNANVDGGDESWGLRAIAGLWKADPKVWASPIQPGDCRYRETRDIWRNGHGDSGEDVLGKATGEAACQRQ